MFLINSIKKYTRNLLICFSILVVACTPGSVFSVDDGWNDEFSGLSEFIIGYFEEHPIPEVVAMEQAIQNAVARVQRRSHSLPPPAEANAGSDQQQMSLSQPAEQFAPQSAAAQAAQAPLPLQPETVPLPPLPQGNNGLPLPPLPQGNNGLPLPPIVISRAIQEPTHPFEEINFSHEQVFISRKAMQSLHGELMERLSHRKFRKFAGNFVELQRHNVLWGKMLYAESINRSLSALVSHKDKVRGFLIGFDIIDSLDKSFGLALSVIDTNVKFESPYSPSSANQKSFYCSAYGAFEVSPKFFIKNSFLIGYTNFNVDRNLIDPSASRIDSKHHGVSVSNRLALEYDNVVDNFVITPVLALRLDFVEQNARQEKYMGTDLFRYNSSNDFYLAGEFGVRCSCGYKYTIRPTFFIGYSLDVLHKNSRRESHSLNANYTINNGNSRNFNHFVVKLGAEITLNDVWSANFAYTGNFNRKDRSHLASFGIEAKF